MRSFTRKRIDLTFRLGLGAFGESGTDMVTLEGHRVHCSIDAVGAPAMSTAQIRVYGLTRSLLRQLSSLNAATQVARRNTIAVSAGDDSGVALIFQGQMIVSQVMLNQQPDTPLLIVAQAGALQAVQSVPPTSYSGPTDVATIMQSLAAVMGLGFENNGVQVSIQKPAYSGSPREQVMACAQAAGIEWIIDQGNPSSNGGTLAIWPRDGYRKGDIPLISPSTGLIGYPDYTTSAAGIGVNCVFNPLLRVGGLVKIQSDFEMASGVWQAFKIQHEIQSETIGGEWSSHFDAQPPGGAR